MTKITHWSNRKSRALAVSSWRCASATSRSTVYDIAEELAAQHIELGLTAITEVLREEGFARLPRRKDDERPAGRRPGIRDRGDVRSFRLAI